MQKSAHTSFPAAKEINIKQERFKMEYENDHSEVVEHHIDKQEIFHDTYPYKRFEEYQLPNLERIIKIKKKRN